VHDLTSFGLTVLLVAGALSAALLASKVSARTSIPSAALFLVAAAFASDLFPSLVVSIGSVERVGTVALIVILFDGGSSIGLRRFREAAIPIASLGVLGTFATAGLVALFVHGVFGLGWITAGLLGAASRANRSRRDVLGARGSRDRRPHRDDPRGRVGRERPGRDRADARDDRARNP